MNSDGGCDNVDSFPFLAFSDLLCHLENTGINVSSCNVPSDSKGTKL